MSGFIRPKVVASKCLEFDSCRYNGIMVSSPVVRLLKQYVDFQPICPEVEIGLGIPRDPIRIVDEGDGRKLVQPSTGKDFTDSMNGFTGPFLDSLDGVDGFILKSRSPSCGIGVVKIYPKIDARTPAGKGEGFFGDAVLNKFGHLAVEDEGRLNNFKLRGHFLTKLFALAKLRKISASPKMKDLVKFQADNKLLLMAYNQTAMRKLGRIVANHEGLEVDEVFRLYSPAFSAALARPPKYTSNINVLMHAFGYFSKQLNQKEKAFFLDSLEEYRSERIPLGSVVYMVRSWIMRFGEEYLDSQNYFMPYPEELIEISDSGKGRDLD